MEKKEIEIPHVHTYSWVYHHNGGDRGMENWRVECIPCGSVKFKTYDPNEYYAIIQASK